MNIKSISKNFYTSPLLKKSLQYACENSALFAAATTVVMSAIVRPASILIAPDTNKEDKKISCIKSLASAFIGFLFTYCVSKPFSEGLKKIDNNPNLYLTKDTIKNLSKNSKNLQASKSYQLISQTFKLGLGILLAYPKAKAQNVIIPPVMKKIKEKEKKQENKVTFKGSEKIISNVMNNSFVQKIADKLKNTNFITGMICLSDILSSLIFVGTTQKNKNLDKRQKNILSYNSLISTILCVIGGSSIDKATNKLSDKFLDNFKKFNPDYKNIEKISEGAKVMKSSLIFGIVYYCLIPIVTTVLSSKIADFKNKKTEN